MAGYIGWTLPFNFYYFVLPNTLLIHIER